jgi:hypothetical protein
MYIYTYLIVLSFFIEGLINCTDHMDFVSLRKKLLVCAAITPPVESFIDRYVSLHKKWLNAKYNLFTEKKAASGISELADLCPLCFNTMQPSVMPFFVP